MTIPISPSVSLSPASFSLSGQTITASVAVLNRPAYHGKKVVTDLTEITPKIIINRSPAGAIPFCVSVSACETTHDGANPDEAYMDLHYEWDFGDPSGTELATDGYNGREFNLNNQQGPEATYIYRTAGTYTITLVAKGKDNSGNIVTASTTILKTQGQYYINRGGATGGTFTLTVNGETTSAIAYNATDDEVVTALRALPSLDSTNCETLSGFARLVYLVGDKTGATNTVSINAGSLTGTTGTPFVREEITSVTDASVTVTDLSAWTATYFDSNYGGENGASDGTATKPYTTFTAFKTWLELATSNQVAYLERDSVFTMNAQINITTNGSTSGKRVVARGTGAKPMFLQTAVNASFVWTIAQSNKVHSDCCFSNIAVRVDFADITSFSPTVSTNGTLGNGRDLVKYTVYDNVDWTTTLSGGLNTRFVDQSSNHVLGGSSIFGSTFYQCDCDSGGTSQLAVIITNQANWCAIINNSFAGGDADSIDLIHHIYFKVQRNSSVKYNIFQDGNKNFCINGDAALKATGGSAYSSKNIDFICIDGNRIQGTQNGIDLSNTDNSYSGIRRAYFDKTVVQFNRINPATWSAQKIGVLSYNSSRVTFRYNDMWGCEQTCISIDSVAMEYVSTVVWSIYNNRSQDGRFLRVQGPVAHYVHDNVVSTSVQVGGNAWCITFRGGTEANIAAWDCDANIWHAPTKTTPFFAESGTDVSFATWQAAGNDTNGSVGDPGWADPGAGLFIASPVVLIDWPAGFTGLESSIDGGSSWQAYTNNTPLDIAAYLTTFTTILFRASSDSSTQTHTITGYSAASSEDTVQEDFSVDLEFGGAGNTVYFIIAGGIVYTLATP